MHTGNLSLNLVCWDWFYVTVCTVQTLTVTIYSMTDFCNCESLLREFLEPEVWLCIVSNHSIVAANE